MARILCLLAIMGLPGHGKVLERQGAVFAIQEQSLLEVIMEKLRRLEQTGQLKTHQQEIQARALRFLERPPPVAGITTATTNAAWKYDPSIVVAEDLKDHQGNIFARRGDKVNPLDFYSFGKPLLLLNGDDTAQVSWALKQEGKAVLIQGAPLALAQLYKRAFYFDQGGILVKKFSIKTVPVRISQKGKMLLVETVNLASLKDGQQP